MAGRTYCTVALFQGTAKPSDIIYNVGKVMEGMKRAAAAGADLVIFPELFVSEYHAVVGADAAGDLSRVAEEKYGGSFTKISAAAKENGIAVVYGYPEVERSSGKEKYYNSAQFVDKDGCSLLNYRKVHLWAAENESFSPGDEFPVVDWNGVKVGILICYDVEFPEAVRSLALMGAQLVAVPTAIDVHDYGNVSTVIVPTRALENQLYVAYANYAGVSFWGLSRLSNPLGNTVVCAGSEEALLIAQIPTKTAFSFSYLGDRKPELYGGLVLRSTCDSRTVDSTYCTVALFQGTAKPLDILYNLNKITEGMRRAAGAGADLVIFPELFLSEYDAVIGADAAGDLSRVAEEKYGASFTKISAAAKENSIAVIYGYPEVDRSLGKDEYYNSAQFVDKDGCSLLNCRKVHLWTAAENESFIPGDGFPVVLWNGTKVGVLICYDVSFPEAVRSLALKGAQLVAVPTATNIREYETASTKVVPARALENQLYVAYANYAGVSYWGLSRLSNPLGNTVVCAGSEEALVIARIPTKTNLSFSYLGDRKPELYGEVVKSK